MSRMINNPVPEASAIYRTFGKLGSNTHLRTPFLHLRFLPNNLQLTASMNIKIRQLKPIKQDD